MLQESKISITEICKSKQIKCSKPIVNHAQTYNRSGIVGYGPKKRIGDLTTASFSTLVSSTMAEEGSEEAVLVNDGREIRGEKHCDNRICWLDTKNHPAVLKILWKNMMASVLHCRSVNVYNYELLDLGRQGCGGAWARLSTCNAVVRQASLS